MKVKLPEEVQYLIVQIESKGFDAYAVGGCVRDSVLGRQPKDWDICTSATPSELMEIFAGEHIIPTGLQHGTITIVKENGQYEITTFRSEGEYFDHRRPSSVSYITDLKEDLSRRDFTVNALAYHPSKGLMDYFGGVDDLSKGLIRCVGDPFARFSEDALRILRAVRFAAVLGFSIHNETADAMICTMHTLQDIAVERIAVELNKILLSDNVSKIFIKNFPIICQILPELSSLKGFQQHNPYHIHDVLTHTLYSIDHSPKDLSLRLTMLFHDIGKPQCFTMTDGIGHFYQHEVIGSEIATAILKRLKYDNETIYEVSELVKYHDITISNEKKNVKKWLSRMGEDLFRKLLLVKLADTLAASELSQRENLPRLEAISSLLEEILSSQECFSLKDLAINGHDLIESGMKEGKEIGETLNKLLDMVIEGNIKNNKNDLLSSIYA